MSHEKPSGRLFFTFLKWLAGLRYREYEEVMQELRVTGELQVRVYTQKGD